jgi:Arc/MetJ-type ribon-helix-helix transcriptional regulator
VIISIKLPDDMHAAVKQRVRDLGFKSISAYLRWKLDEDLTIASTRNTQRTRLNPRNKGHKTYLPGSIRSRVEAIPAGQPFTVDDIINKTDDRQSVAVTLHYLNRTSVIHLRRSAVRTRTGWEAAVFIRNQS